MIYTLNKNINFTLFVTACVKWLELKRIMVRTHYLLKLALYLVLMVECHKAYRDCPQYYRLAHSILLFNYKTKSQYC